MALPVSPEPLPTSSDFGRGVNRQVGFALVWWTPKLKRFEERLEVSDEQPHCEAEASVQAVQF